MTENVSGCFFSEHSVLCHNSKRHTSYAAWIDHIIVIVFIYLFIRLFISLPRIQHLHVFAQMLTIITYVAFPTEHPETEEHC